MIVVLTVEVPNGAAYRGSVKVCIIYLELYCSTVSTQRTLLDATVQYM